MTPKNVSNFWIISPVPCEHIKMKSCPINCVIWNDKLPILTIKIFFLIFLTFTLDVAFIWNTFSEIFIWSMQKASIFLILTFNWWIEVINRNNHLHIGQHSHFTRSPAFYPPLSLSHHFSIQHSIRFSHVHFSLFIHQAFFRFGYVFGWCMIFSYVTKSFLCACVFLFFFFLFLKHFAQFRFLIFYICVLCSVCCLIRS